MKIAAAMQNHYLKNYSYAENQKKESFFGGQANPGRLDLLIAKILECRYPK